jgi:hypothetical protein
MNAPASRGGATSLDPIEDKALPGGLHRIQSVPSLGADLPPDPWYRRMAALEHRS